ncbi:MAG TPA: hypothetical protein VGO47_04820, partial [Chlamydiales bacterium]|nr:hypothetical protein [Chlamydiales bacterium]
NAWATGDYNHITFLLTMARERGIASMCHVSLMFPSSFNDCRAMEPRNHYKFKLCDGVIYRYESELLESEASETQQKPETQGWLCRGNFQMQT